MLLLNTRYPSENIEDVSDDCIANFVSENNFESFEELFVEVDNIEIKGIGWQKNQKIHLYKLITFVYSCLTKFSNNKYEIKTINTKISYYHMFVLLLGYVVMHHSHITAEIISYAHDFCNKKFRKAQNLIPVLEHNLFSLDFFFVVKGICLRAWRTKQLNIREKESLKRSICKYWQSGQVY